MTTTKKAARGNGQPTASVNIDSIQPKAGVIKIGAPFQGYPDGYYRAIFKHAVVDADSVRLLFTITEGPHRSETFSRVIPLDQERVSSDSPLIQFAIQLSGQPLEPGQEFTFLDYEGAEGVICVEGGLVSSFHQGDES